MATTCLGGQAAARSTATRPQRRSSQKVKRSPLLPGEQTILAGLAEPILPRVSRCQCRLWQSIHDTPVPDGATGAMASAPPRRKAGRTEEEERHQEGHTESYQEADAAGKCDATTLAGFLPAATNANWAGEWTVLPYALAAECSFRIKSDSGK